MFIFKTFTYNILKLKHEVCFARAVKIFNTQTGQKTTTKHQRSVTEKRVKLSKHITLSEVSRRPILILKQYIKSCELLAKLS